eukprot:3608902-Pleurochrysis_carterae.AAC.1
MASEAGRERTVWRASQQHAQRHTRCEVADARGAERDDRVVVVEDALCGADAGEPGDVAEEAVGVRRAVEPRRREQGRHGRRGAHHVADRTVRKRMRAEPLQIESRDAHRHSTLLKS